MVYLGDKEIHVDHVEREKNEAMALGWEVGQRGH